MKKLGKTCRIGLRMTQLQIDEVNNLVKLLTLRRHDYWHFGAWTRTQAINLAVRELVKSFDLPGRKPRPIKR